MSRHIGFISNVKEELNYREDHRGIPITIIVFMFVTRLVAYVLTMIPVVFAVVILFDEDVRFWINFSLAMIYAMGANSKLDPWTRIGFKLFRWVITKR